MTMPNETIDKLTEELSVLNYSTKAKKFNVVKKNKPSMLICEDFHTNKMLKQPITEN